MKRNKNMKYPPKLVRTSFGVFDRAIAKGEALAFDAWLDAGLECVKKCGGNASLYAKSAVWDSARSGKNTLTQTETTIRLYVGAVVRLAKKHQTRSAIVSAYDAVYESREIGALLAFAKGNGQRKQGKKRSSNAVALTKRSAHNAWNKAKSFDEFWELISE